MVDSSTLYDRHLTGEVIQHNLMIVRLRNQPTYLTSGCQNSLRTTPEQSICLAHVREVPYFIF